MHLFKLPCGFLKWDVLQNIKIHSSSILQTFFKILLYRVKSPQNNENEKLYIVLPINMYSLSIQRRKVSTGKLCLDKYWNEHKQSIMMFKLKPHITLLDTYYNFTLPDVLPFDSYFIVSNMRQIEQVFIAELPILVIFSLLKFFFRATCNLSNPLNAMGNHC